MYLIIGELDGYIKESNGNIAFGSTYGSKEIVTKLTKLWYEIKYLIKTINGGEAGECDKDLMKIRFESNDNLPLGIILKLSMLTIVVKSVFEEDGKYFQQVFSYECLVGVIKMLLYDRIDVSEGIEINKTGASKECMLCHYWYCKNNEQKFESHVFDDCHDILMMAYVLKNIAILNVKGVDYRLFYGT